MKITKHRTAPYQVKTNWVNDDNNHLIMTYGFVAKDLNPNCERAMRLLMKVKEMKERNDK